MTEELPLPRFDFRPDPPSLWTMFRQGVSDFPGVVPAAIFEQPAVQLAGSRFGAPLVVADPDLIREVLNDRDERFTRDKLLRRMFRRAWGQGLAGAEGEAWQRQRRAAAPAFRPAAVADNSPAFITAAARAASEWPCGEPVELTQRVARIIADIVFEVLVDGGGEVDTALVAADMRGYINRIASWTPRDLLPLPESWHDRLSGVTGDPAVNRLRALARKLADGRSTQRGKADLISLLEGVGPVEDNICGLFPAAMDTTAAGASWTLYTLALRPEWQHRVAAEARGCSGNFAAERLGLTRRVVQEALRLYPPAPFMIRSAATDGQLGTFALNRGQPVLLAIYAMHRHRSLWENPDAFDPDRFLPGRGAHPGWLPFGAGPRVCIAAQFALAEITAVVARLLSELELAGAKPHLDLRATTRSTTGLNVIASARA